MSSPEDKLKHSKRLKRKKNEASKRQEGKAGRVRSVIAKEMLVSGKCQQRVVLDKRGKKHDLDKMTFHDLVEAIQDE